MDQSVSGSSEAVGRLSRRHSTSFRITRPFVWNPTRLLPSCFLFLSVFFLLFWPFSCRSNVALVCFDHIFFPFSFASSFHSIIFFYSKLIWFHCKSPAFHGFYWVLLGSTGFYRVLLGFTGFYWVSQDFTGFRWVLQSFTRFYWVLRGYTGFHGVLLGFIGFYWVLLGFTRFYWVLRGYTGFH